MLVLVCMRGRRDRPSSCPVERQTGHVLTKTDQTQCTTADASVNISGEFGRETERQREVEVFGASEFPIGVAARISHREFWKG